MAEDITIYRDIEDPASRVDFPVSPGWAAHYASIRLTPPLPAGLPMRVTTPAPWEYKQEWPDYDPSKVDVGENSPLWDGLRALFPTEETKQAIQEKLWAERLKEADASQTQVVRHEFLTNGKMF